jgi:hypothetical protein
MGCSSSKTKPSAPAPRAKEVTGTLLTTGSGAKCPKATQPEAQMPEEQPCIEDAADKSVPDPSEINGNLASTVLHSIYEKALSLAERAGAPPPQPPSMEKAAEPAQAHPETLVAPKHGGKGLTSRVYQNPQGWQEEGILFPHEGIRFLMQELCSAIEVMDPRPAWKWNNLATWYQDYFYDVVHHHHDAEEKIYLPWIQTRMVVPAKITSDHPELMQSMDELRDMLKGGSGVPVGKRGEHLFLVRQRVVAFVETMEQHLAEEEEALPGLLREGGFTEEEEGPIVAQIIQSLGLDGNKRALPPMLHAYALWAGTDKAEAFVSSNLPLPIQYLYRHFWVHDFQNRHMGLLASLKEGVDTDPFASRRFC